METPLTARDLAIAEHLDRLPPDPPQRIFCSEACQRGGDGCGARIGNGWVLCGEVYG